MVVGNVVNIGYDILCNTLGIVWRFLKWFYLDFLPFIVQYIAILVNDNTIYWYCKMNQYNILYCQVGPIQYIVLSDRTNIIYCIARSNQYNILLTIYCNIL
jgi:hypothetical protein